ncbi:inositol monophosphatase [Natronospirillum operosum]|uniref:Inositol-1-monophosphatase n=1 Tax=Natronospirillum operosum TaxID=2759953 RepID=A0A4Z0WEZ5_9GAMM|nr:inositol monophosphatase [Natronospirillum operosum]TGG95188.1 inositol monophosphatase [Natronospirillum operosum]
MKQEGTTTATGQMQRLSDQALQARLVQASNIARAAGELALNYFNKGATLDIQTKGAQDWVTQADLEVERFIRRQLQSHYPEDTILGEEYGLNSLEDDQLMWLVDPIDGTTFFLKGIPQWAVVIGLAIGSETLLAVVFEPVSGELFAAIRGQGATLNGHPIQVDPTADLSSGLVAVSSSVKLGGATSARMIERLVNDGVMYCRLGSCALCLAYVASGRLLGMYEPLVHPWDSWAGELLVQEAGGRTLERSQGADLGRPGPAIAAAPNVWDIMGELRGI